MIGFSTDVHYLSIKRMKTKTLLDIFTNLREMSLDKEDLLNVLTNFLSTIINDSQRTSSEMHNLAKVFEV